MTYHIKIIHPSACSHPGVLEANIAKLDKLECVFDVSKDFDASHWPYSSQNVERRLKEITAAMQDDQYSVIFAGRGGYGVSDLLPFIDWTTLKKHKPKVIVGFSDISALLVSVYHFLGWPCLHAPMPGTNTWNHEGADVKRLLSLITSDAKSWNGVLTLENFSNSIIDGELFGGCFSVLTNLIGTPYLNIPSKDWILFIEDLNENPARLMRFWNQWQQSGNLKNF